MRTLNLLTPERIDVSIKHIYARNHELGLDSDWYVEPYAEHLRVWNNFLELNEDDWNKIKKLPSSVKDKVLQSLYSNKCALFPDGHVMRGHKCSLDDFRSVFHRIIEVVKSGRRIEPVLVNGVNVLVNGSHRVASSLLYGVDVDVSDRVVRQRVKYDFNFFRNCGFGRLEEKWCELAALEYVRLKQDECKLVTLFPSAIGNEGVVEGILNSHGRLVYRKKIEASGNLPFNLVHYLYHGERWLTRGSSGEGKERYPGVLEKEELCFSSENPVVVFLVEMSDENARVAKEKIRGVFDIGNHSVHINDSRTFELSSTLFSENGVNFLRERVLCSKLGNFDSLFDSFRTWLSDRNCDNFCVVGSAVLSVLGLRDCKDFDVLEFRGKSRFPRGVSGHDSELVYYDAKVDDMIHNPQNYFSYRGVKFLSPILLKRMKQKRGEKKDVEDVGLLNTIGIR